MLEVPGQLRIRGGGDNGRGFFFDNLPGKGGAREDGIVVGVRRVNLPADLRNGGEGAVFDALGRSRQGEGTGKGLRHPGQNIPAGLARDGQNEKGCL